MKVYVFGNPDSEEDNLAIKMASRLECTMVNVECTIISPNQDLPFSEEERVVILDTIKGIDDVVVTDNLNRFVPSPRNSVHDFDLGFQLKYLKKLGKLGKVTIIGIPQKGEINYERIQSILRKLVAQDMQGS